jgi:hypothetical protein
VKKFLVLILIFVTLFIFSNEKRTNDFECLIGVKTISYHDVNKRYDNLNDCYTMLEQQSALTRRHAIDGVGDEQLRLDVELLLKEMQITQEHLDRKFNYDELSPKGKELTESYDKLFREELDLGNEDARLCLYMLNNPEVLQNQNGDRILARLHVIRPRMRMIETEMKKLYKEIKETYPLD